MWADDGSRRFFPRRWIPTEYAEFGPLEFQRLQGSRWMPVPVGILERVENRLLGSDSTDGRLEIGFNGRGSRTHLVLKRATMARPLRWKVDLVGLSWVDGTLIAASDSAQVGFIRPPTWTDASGDDVTHQIPWSYSGGYMTLTPDFTGAVFPVTVDPDYSIAAQGDDGYVGTYNWPPYTFNVTNTSAAIGDGGSYGDYHAFFRFAGIAAAKDQECTAATLTVVANNDDSDDMLTNIFGVNEDNHAAPTTYAEWATDHGIHTTGVAWDWTTNRVGGTSYTSPGIAAIFNVLFARAGWATGQAVGLHQDDDGTPSSRQIFISTYDHASYTEPVLSLTLAAGGEDATVTLSAASFTTTAPQTARSGNAGRTLTAAAFALTAPQAVTAVSTPATVTLTAAPFTFTAPQAGWSGDAARAPPSAQFAATAPQATPVVQADATVTPSTAAFGLTAEQTARTADATRILPEPEWAEIWLGEGKPASVIVADATASPATAAFTLTVDQAIVVADAVREPFDSGNANAQLFAPTPTIEIAGHATVTPSTAALGLSADQAAPSGDANTSPAAPELTLTAPQTVPTAGVSATVTPATVLLALSADQAAHTADAHRSPAAAVFALSADQAARSGNVTRTPGTAALTLSADQAARTADGVATPATAGLTLTGPQAAPAITTPDATATPAVAALTLSADQATPAVTGDATVTPAVAAFSLTSPQAAHAADGSRSPSTAALTLTAPQATITVPATVTPAAAPLTLAAPQADAQGGGAVDTVDRVAYIDQARSRTGHAEQAKTRTAYVDQARTRTGHV